MISLTLPLPPSTNRLWRSVGRKQKRPRVIRSKEYLAWLDEAGWSLKQQRPRPVKGKVSIFLTVGKTRKDPDNLFKATLDLLVAHSLIDGDGPACVRSLNLSVDETVDGVRVTIEPYYDSNDDTRKSVNLCLATVKERMANGGEPWPKPESPHPQPTEESVQCSEECAAQSRPVLERAAAARGGGE